MTETTRICIFVTLLAVAKGQAYGGQYQYKPQIQPQIQPQIRPQIRPQYPPYYKMAPVYSWYQHDQKPASTVEMEPKTQDITPFEAQGLLYSNLHRQLHGTQDLQLDHSLSLEAARYARDIAQSLVVKHMQLDSRPGQAENIYLRCKAFSKGISAFEAVKEWYSTVCHWNFDNPVPLNDKGKPFSRLIWKSHQRMGMGRANFEVDNFNCSVVVARYSPYINSLDFMQNVPKGNFKPIGCQYVKEDNEDFIVPPQPGKACQKISGFRGQMLQETSACTIKQLFAIFGASVRRGKQGFSVVL